MVSGPQLNNLGGMIMYDNAFQTGISNATVQLLDSGGNVAGSGTTDTDGSYFIPNIPDGAYTLHVTTAHLPGGINSSDALIDLKCLLNLTVLSGLRLKAGDVNGNNVVNSIDALMISKRAPGLVGFLMGIYC